MEKVIDNARSTLSQGEGGVACRTKTSLQELRNHHQQLLAGVEKLYKSLNIQDKCPELDGVDIKFVRTLLLARDLKINIRKRAVGSFLEWERLDQAVGGKHQALGTHFSIYYITQTNQTYRDKGAPAYTIRNYQAKARTAVSYTYLQ